MSELRNGAILVKPAGKINVDYFMELVNESIRYAKEVGLTEEDITRTIKEYRAEKRTQRENRN